MVNILALYHGPLLMGQSSHSFHFLCFQLYMYFFEAKAKLNTIISKFEKVLQTKDDIDVLLSTA